MAARSRGRSLGTGHGLGNLTRDLKDEAIGEAAEPAPGGPPMRWPPSPKMKRPGKDSFHTSTQSSTVSGGNANSRADRKSSGTNTFRRGHFMKRGS